MRNKSLFWVTVAYEGDAIKTEEFMRRYHRDKINALSFAIIIHALYLLPMLHLVRSFDFLATTTMGLFAFANLFYAFCTQGIVDLYVRSSAKKTAKARRWEYKDSLRQRIKALEKENSRLLLKMAENRQLILTAEEAQD